MTTGVGATLAAGPALSAAAGAKLRVAGAPPWFANLARVMDPAPGLLDQLATDFAPRAARLETQAAYWLAFSGYALDRLSALALQGQQGPSTLREQAWAIYATGYWATLEIQKNWGVPLGVRKLGHSARAPSEAMLQGFADKLAQRQALLASGPGACLSSLPDLLREEPLTGLLHGLAYTAGVQVVKTEDAPLGDRPRHLKGDSGAIRINPRDFMRVDYAVAVPAYLPPWRTALETALGRNPGGLEAIIAGRPGQKDLRAIWSQGVGWGRATWGAGATDNWTQAYLNESVRWCIVMTFGLEATALAGFVALLDRDEEAARRAVLANAISLGGAGAAVMGLLDTGGALPRVVPACRDVGDRRSGRDRSMIRRVSAHRAPDVEAEISTTGMGTIGYRLRSQRAQGSARPAGPNRGDTPWLRTSQTVPSSTTPPP